MKKLSLLLCLLLMAGFCLAGSAMAIVPPPALEFDDQSAYGSTYRFAIFDDTDILSHDDWVRNFVIKDYETLRDFYLGEPEWSFNLLEAPEGITYDTNNFDWEGDTRMRGLDVQIHGVGQPEDQVSFEVTCAWGGQEIRGVCNVVYYTPERLPDSLELPDVMFATVGQGDQYQVVRPDSYNFGDNVRLDIDPHSNCTWNLNSSVPRDSWFFLQFNEAGIFPVDISLTDNNINIHKRMIFHVFDTDGSEPPMPELSLEEGRWSIPRAIFEDSDSIDHNNWTRNFTIENYDVMAHCYGGPAWWDVSLDEETPSGVVLDSNVWIDDNGYPVFDVYANGDPAGPCTVSYTVTCGMGDMTASEQVNLVYSTPDSLPDGLNLPDEVREAQIGIRYSLPVYTNPEGYSFGEELRIDIDPHSDCATTWQWVDDVPTQFLTFHESGVIPVDIWLVQENISIHKTVIFYVQDEEGNEPSLALKLQEGRTVIPRAVFEDNDVIGHNSWTRNFVIDNYDSLKAMLDGEPDWSVNPVGGTQGVELNGVVWDGDNANKGFDVFIYNEPDTPCAVTYEVVCQWGDLSETVQVELDYNYPDSLPDELSLDLPDEIHDVRIGGQFSLPVNIYGESYLFGEELRIDIDPHSDCETTWQWVGDVPTQFLTFHESGVFPVDIWLVQENINIHKTVVFYVQDEEGNEPSLALKLQEGRTEIPRAIFMDNGDVGHNSWTRNFVIDNYDFLKTMLDGEPSWYISRVGNTYGVDLNGVVWDGDDANKGFDVFSDNEPNTPCIVTYTVICQWGELSETVQVALDYNYPENMPDDLSLDLPDEIHDVRIWEPYSFSVNTVPEGYRYGEELRIDIDPHSDCETTWQLAGDVPTQILTFHESGVFPVDIWLVQENINIHKTVIFNVTDEGDNALAFEDGLGDEEKVFSTRFEESDNVFMDSWIGNFEIADYDYLRILHDGEPQWTIRVDGADLSEEEDFFVNNYGEGRGLELHLALESIPEEECTVVFTAHCEWDGEIIEASKTVYFINSALPTGSTELPTIIYLKPGETRHVDLDFVNFDPTVAELTDLRYVHWNANDFDGNIEFDDHFDERYINMTAYEGTAGEYAGSLYICAGNICAGRQNVLFVISDEEDFEFEPAFEYNDELILAMDPGVEDGSAYADSYLQEVWFVNYDIARALYQTEGTWNCEVIDNDWGIHSEVTGDGGMLQLWNRNVPGPDTENTDATIRVTVAFGENTFSRDFQVHYFYSDPPEGNDIPNRIDLTAGEPTRLSFHFTGYPYDTPFNEFHINMDVHDDSEWGCEHWDEDDGNTRHVTFYEPGIHAAWVEVQTGNLTSGRNVLFYVADEEGNVPGADELQVNIGRQLEEVAILNQWWDGDYGQATLHTEDILAEFWFDGAYYSAMQSLMNGEEPEWGIIQPTGAIIDTEIRQDTQDNGNRSAFLCIGSMPEQPVSAEYTVTCDWGNLHWETSLDIDFRDDISLPNALVISDDISIKAGEWYDCNYTLDPRGWEYDFNDRHFDFWIPSADVDHEFLYDHDHDTLSIRINEPGTYMGIVCLREGSINLAKRITFHVADEEGNVPLPNLRFRRDYMNAQERHFAIFEDNDEIGLEHDNYLYDLEIDDNYDLLYNYFETGPVWNVMLEDHQNEVKLSWHNFEDEGERYAPKGISIHADGAPSEPCDVHFHVDCTWGKGEDAQTITSTGVIHYEVVDLPTGANIPDTIDLDVNEGSDLDLSFVPEGYTFGDDDRISYYFHEDFEREDWEDGHTLHIEPFEPGYFTAWVAVVSGNISIGKDVLFRVRDEDGNLPEDVAPCIGNYPVVDYYLGDLNNDEGWLLDRSLHSFTTENISALRECYGDNPEIHWNYEVIEGKADVVLSLKISEDMLSSELIVESLPAKPGYSVIRLSNSWNDGPTGTVDLRVNWLAQPENMADDLTIPDRLILSVGETRRFEVYLNDINDPGDLDSESAWFRFDDNDIVEIWEDPDDGNGLTLTGLQPGLARGSVFEGTGTNLVFRKYITVYVRDTDNYSAMFLPGSLQTIEEEAFESTNGNIANIPNVCETIGPRAFADCNALREVYIPNSVTEISDTAFEGCHDIVFFTNNQLARNWADAHGIPWFGLYA